MDLTVAAKPDSMELCFAGEGDYRNAFSDTRPGKFLDTSGNLLGEHEGISSYTIGQRRGLRVAGGKPLYVLRISPHDNAVTLGTREESFRQDVHADTLNVLIPELLLPKTVLYGKIRSYGDSHPCRMISQKDDTLHVRFDEPQFAPTPGQRLVLYDKLDRVVAGGTIR